MAVVRVGAATVPATSAVATHWPRQKGHEQFANGVLGTVTDHLFVHLALAGRLLEHGERHAERCRHGILGDDPGDVLRGECVEHKVERGERADLATSPTQGDRQSHREGAVAGHDAGIAPERARVGCRTLHRGRQPV